MRHLIFLYFISIRVFSVAQDTLREQYTNMYSSYYILFETGKFQYHFNHCTGQTLSFGSYVKSRNSIKFNYEDVLTPETQIIQTHGPNQDSISIELLNIIDSTKMDYFRIQIGNTYAATIDGKYSFLRGQNDHSQIVLTYFRDTINFETSPDYNVYKIYTHPIYVNYSNSGIAKLKKKNEYYYYKTKVRDPNEEEPWKRGKTRKFIRVYSFENLS